MELLYGRPVADAILNTVREEIARSGKVPGLAVILIGNDPASHLYARLKEKAAIEIGMHFEKHIFSETESETVILKKIEELNGAEDIHGIIVQVPLPNGFDTDKIIAAIDPKKDADGFHPETVRRFLAAPTPQSRRLDSSPRAGERGAEVSIPVFPDALLELAKSSGKSLPGLSGVVVANSEYFGSVMLQAMQNEGITARMILGDDFQKGEEKIDDVDIVFSACGVPNMITSHQVQEGAILIDGGISKQEEQIVGDVDHESVTSKASFLSPVPGGVGPVTIACLLRRTLHLSQKKV